MRGKALVRAACAAAVCAAMAGVAGCGSSPAYPQLGTKGDDTVDVLIVNGLDEAGVSGVSLRATGTESWSETLSLASGDDGAKATLAPGETAELHASPVSAASYDLLVACDGDEDDVEAWAVDLAGAKQVTVRVTDDGVGYVDYVLADGTEGSTEDAAVAKVEADRRAADEAQAEEERKQAEEAAAAEAAAQAQAEAEAAAAAEAQAQAEAEAAAQAEAAEAQQSYGGSGAYSSSGGESGSYSGGESSAYVAPAAPAPAPVTTSEDCVADNIAFD